MYSRNGTLNAAIADDIGMPLLPDGVIPEGDDSHQWLDDYCEWSSYMSPSGFSDFHEATAIFGLSVVAARRLVVDYGDARYTPLYILLAAPSTVWAKSTTVRVIRTIMEKAGLDHFFCVDDSTPEMFLYMMSQNVPANYYSMTSTQKELFLKSVAFAGQRGWINDEFGSHIESMVQKGSYMSAYRGIIRQLDECPNDYKRATRKDGIITVFKPYLSVLGNITPADLKPVAHLGSRLWDDGYWPRFAFVCPPPNAKPYGTGFHIERKPIPDNVIGPLYSMHKRLGIPVAKVSDREVISDPLTETSMAISSDIYDIFENYRQTMVNSIDLSKCPDLKGQYGRFPNKVLRIAALLEYVEGSTVLSKKNMIRAMHVVEHWRTGLHSIYSLVNDGGYSKESRLEDRVYSRLVKMCLKRDGGYCPAYEIAQQLNIGTGEATAVLDQLERGARVSSEQHASRTRWYRPTEIPETNPAQQIPDSSNSSILVSR